MTMTAIILIILIAGALLYTVYDEAVIPFLKGKTYLSVRLRKRSYLDELLFAGFLIVAFISNLLHGGSGTNNVCCC
ncbi:DUF986 family protein [Terrilactibacillus sp. S3-3]|nr:DUF986 family protein [Terrilactibacillus sp. S3-3]